MKFSIIKENRSFIGRDFERDKLASIAHSREASIAVVYGRRRVGKTELIEQSFRTRNLLKFEGIEGASEVDERKHLLLQLSRYVEDPLIAKLDFSTWTEVFMLMFKFTAKGKWTIFFDEVQWLAAYKTNFVSELKYVWDNFFRKNPELIVVLCGSSPSFIINKVLHSKALYNRSQHEIPLHEFSLFDVQQFLKKSRSLSEVMDAFLTVGGIPEYLKYLDRDSSIFLGLCKNSFTQGSFFSNEYQRIFSSSLGKNPHYMKILRFLSNRKCATRNELLGHLRTTTGGRLTDLLRDLELCGFITHYTPFQLPSGSLVSRYHISDQYLQFYFKFIEPNYEAIQTGIYNKESTRPLNIHAYDQWLGFAFERFCRKHHSILAHIMNFGAVDYQAGAFFNRETQQNCSGFQIDLVFERKDKVYTICEIKYVRTLVDARVISDFERKIERFQPRPGYTIEKVLITKEEEPSLQSKRYFDRIITLSDLFKNAHS